MEEVSPQVLASLLVLLVVVSLAGTWATLSVVASTPVRTFEFGAPGSGSVQLHIGPVSESYGEAAPIATSSTGGTISLQVMS